MGSLINTKGTRHLMNYYNKYFDKNSIDNVRTNPQLMADFAVSNPNAARIYVICENNSLYPGADSKHPRLLTRWKYYLSTLLDPANQEKMRAAIYQALINQKSDGSGYVYSAISFDCIEGKSKNVLSSDEFRLKGGDTDDSGLDANTFYKKIVLVTDPMDRTVPVALDDQAVPLP